jgi:competence protein ComEA
MIRLLRRWGAALLIGLVIGLPQVASAQTLVNVNTASAEELQTLPGIGPTKAGAIVAHRQQHGPFSSVEDLVEVTGIGAGTLNNIRSLVTIGEGGDAPPNRAAQFDDEPTVDLRGDGSSLGTPGEDGGTASTREPAPSPGSAGGLINVNTASAEELQSLPGIGPTKAAAIIQHRQQNGPFTSVEQLDDVPGIGPATMNNIRALVTVD